MPAASLRALLTGAIDYAGLFPPASLALEPALRNHAEYIRLPDAWMLGAFILPVAEFDATGCCLSQFEKGYPLRISALGPRKDNAEAFLRSLSASLDSIGSFRSRCNTAASIEQLEMPLPSDVNAEVLKAMRSTLADSNLKTFWEAPAKIAGRVVELLAENNAANPDGKFGFKLRTGGVTAEAFPSSSEIGGALVAAGKQGVPIKFTAGLHHPVRLFHESVQTKMHGFLNVIGGGLLALEHGWTEAQIAKLLDDEDPVSFSFTEDFFVWREWKISTERIRIHRGLVTSLGSCSFDEPRDDLRALKLL
jgi:hypothetical protein